MSYMNSQNKHQHYHSTGMATYLLIDIAIHEAIHGATKLNHSACLRQTLVGFATTPIIITVLMH